MLASWRVACLQEPHHLLAVPVRFADDLVVIDDAALVAAEPERGNSGVSRRHCPDNGRTASSSLNPPWPYENPGDG